MVLPPKELMFRLVFWAAVFGWAVWKMQDLRTGDLVVPDMFAGPLPPDPSVPVPIPPPEVLEPAAGQAPDVVDPEAAFGVMDAALRATATCHVTGTLGARLGADGLAEAWVRGGAVLVGAGKAPLDTAALACLTERLWALPWPRTALGFEMEREVAEAVTSVPPRPVPAPD